MVYAYIRRKGRSNEEAKDLTQGFFTEVVLGRELVQKNDPSKARFRTYLEAALRRYLHDVHEARTARKRRPAQGYLVHLGGLESLDLPELSEGASPDEAFTYAWAANLLAECLAAVEAACRKSGQDKHWEVFRRKVVAPLLTGAPAPSRPARSCVGNWASTAPSAPAT